MSGKDIEKDRPRSGNIRVTWAQCPNKDCASRDWAAWHVDFHESEFQCGTCREKLMPAIFIPAGTVLQVVCPECQKKSVRSTD